MRTFHPGHEPLPLAESPQPQNLQVIALLLPFAFFPCSWAHDLQQERSDLCEKQQVEKEVGCLVRQVPCKIATHHYAHHEHQGVISQHEGYAEHCYIDTV